MRLALLFALALVTSGCGGRTELIDDSDAGYSVQTGTYTSVSTGRTPVGTGTATATSTYPASCFISASNYDRACATEMDCTIVPLGNFCAFGTFECGESISVAALAKYSADVANTPVGSGIIVSESGCRTSMSPCCRQGQCTTVCQSPVDEAGPMSACDTTSCTGCCSTTGQCVAGTAASACGSRGNACAICPGGTCSGGMCSGAVVVLFGGGTISSLDDLDDTWTFNGSSWTQVPVSNPPSARSAATMATLGNEVVLFGGETSNGTLNDTWTFNGSTWTQVSVPSAPPARGSATMATLGNEVVLFGGQTPASPEPVAINDTWTFNGSSWTQVSVSSRPPARDEAMMATLGREVVLFGGLSGVSALDDTWIFDGSSWAQVSVPSPPPARWGASMATLGSDVVLFGGYGTAYLSDTWTFDGSTWTQVSVSSAPPATWDASMATLGSNVVLFGGGSSNNGFMDDSWTFDGAAWSPISEMSPPPARFEASMAALP